MASAPKGGKTSSHTSKTLESDKDTLPPKTHKKKTIKAVSPIADNSISDDDGPPPAKKKVSTPTSPTGSPEVKDTPPLAKKKARST